MSVPVEQTISGGPSRVAPELSGSRVLLVHHWMYTWAGAERCLEQLLLLMPHAEVLTGIVTPQMRATHGIAQRASESWVGAVPGARRHHRWFLPLHALAFSRFDTSRYDLVISISHAFEKAVRAQKRGAPHVCYCLTPPRYLWDLSDAHDELAGPLQRAALRVSRPWLRALDRSSARGVDRFVSISRYVAQRVRDCYGRDSAVVYPPVMARQAAGSMAAARKPFLLTLGRLVPYKRVDLAIAAAESLGIPLVVAGDGPDRERLERLAGPNTSFLGAVSEEDAGRLLSTCSAFVFCAEDDFGIAPLEANAHGAPVVAYARGGAAETIRDDVSGVLFHQQTAGAVAEAIRRCLTGSWKPDVLRQNADRFSPERFRDQMRVELGAALRGGTG